MKALQKFILILVVVAVVMGGGWYFFTKGQQDFVIKPGEKLTESQVEQLIARVGRFLVLPSDEQPSVAAISDAQELAQRQSFYKDAQDGNILIVYSNKAIIYDAVADQLVNVGPIVRTDTELAPTASDSSAPTPTPEATPVPVAITVEVRNGTQTPGLASALANQLRESELYEVEAVGDATTGYDNTVIVFLASDDEAKAATVAGLAEELNATVVTELPTGERATSHEVLILIGQGA
jgi:hypothetical protein